MSESPAAGKPFGMPDLDAEQLWHRNRQLTLLNDIAETLNRSFDLEEALTEAMARVVELLALQTGWVFLTDDAGRSFRLAAHHDLPPALAYPGPAWRGGCDCQWLFQAGRLEEAVNIVECSRLRGASGERQGLAYHASVPLHTKDRSLGILNVASPERPQLSDEELQLLTAVGHFVGAAADRARLQAQGRRLAAVEERNRLAREIHDTLAQSLAALALKLEATDALWAEKPARAREQLRRALELTREALAEARHSVEDLRAPSLQQRSLQEALAELVRELGADTEIKGRTDLPSGELGFTARLEAGLYRVAQEALSNVRKHARARRVWLKLSRDESSVTLDVRDDGVGFDPDQLGDPAVDQGHYGLVGMRERARLLGGQLTIASAPGKGTRLTVRVPLERGEPHTSEGA